MAKRRAKQVRFFVLVLCLAAGASWPRLSKAGTLLVYNNHDAGAGSLRQAIQDNNALGGSNTIVFSNTVTGTITLGSQLTIATNVTIPGPGANVLTVSGNNTTRVFTITGGTASLSGLTIANGQVSDVGAGAGIQSVRPLTLRDCIFSNNTNTVDVGGALYAEGPTTTVVNCTFQGNSSHYEGGAIYSIGQLVVTNCTFTANSSLAFAGGAIWVNDTAGIYHSTIASNTAPSGAGGGISMHPFGAINVRNTIIAENSAFTDPDVHGSFTSEGYNLIGAAGTSSGWTGLGDQVGNVNIPLNPLLGPLQDNGGPTPTMLPLPGSPAIDQGSSSGVPLDQRGRTRPFDNPGIPNATGGDGTDIGAVEVGAATLLVSNRNDSGSGSLRQALQYASPTEGDTIQFAPAANGTISLTNGELLVAKSLTIAGPGAGLLAVSGNNAFRVIHITSGAVNISGLTISDGRVVGAVGPAGLNGQNIQGAGILNEASLTMTSCVISNNTLIGGQGGSQNQSGYSGNGGNALGGGIYNLGTLTLAQCALVANAGIGGAGGTVTDGQNPGVGGQGWGGGLYGEGPVILSGCTVSGNNATAGTGLGGPGGGVGGGLYTISSLNLTNCTVVSNTASGSTADEGGGIANYGTLTVRSSTIAGNQAHDAGGLLGGGDLGNTILAANAATALPDGSGTIASSDYNLIQDTNGCFFTGTTTHNLISVDPRLGPLQDNGGPTFTMALLAGSPAVDKGKSFGATTDQRGAPRPFDFASIPNASGGDGSDIGAFESGSPRLNIQQLGSAALLSWPSYYGGVTVQSVTNLPASNNWVSVPGTPVVVADQYVLTNSPVSGKRFYRLSHP